MRRVEADFLQLHYIHAQLQPAWPPAQPGLPLAALTAPSVAGWAPARENILGRVLLLVLELLGGREKGLWSNKRG